MAAIIGSTWTTGATPYKPKTRVGTIRSPDSVEDLASEIFSTPTDGNGRMVVFYLVHPEGASYRCAIRRQSQALIALTQTSQWVCVAAHCAPPAFGNVAARRSTKA